MKMILASLIVSMATASAEDVLVLQPPAAAQQQPINIANFRMDGTPNPLFQIEGTKPNPLIDYAQFLKISKEVEPVRQERRLTEEQFGTMAAQPGTLVLDARSADKYAMRHLRGAVSLPFTDFTADALAKVIPAKDTRVLIYCNNNFTGAPRSMRGKAARASLNISTYIALATYGYTNVYELGPLLDVATTKLPFAGAEAEPENYERSKR